MANLSQERRERMLAFLQTLKAQHTDDDSLMALGEIEKELKAKKYGLVWEEHEEEVDVKMRTHIPVFTVDVAWRLTAIPAANASTFCWRATTFTLCACLKKHIVAELT